MPPHDSAVQTVRATSSAVQPVYVRLSDAKDGGDSRQTSFAADSLAALLPETGRLTPDWTAWAEILAFGAPLAGRTPFAGVRRLQPGERAVRDEDGVRVEQEHWSWLGVEPEPQLRPQQLTAEVLEALRDEVRSAAEVGVLNPMLSGGRDSRLLTALAAHEQPEGLTAWTTSSDTGTSMEELVSARVAKRLGISHRIVPAVHAQFPKDAADYARTVEHMASFHIWLMPVSRTLAEHRRSTGSGTVLDGLGGGIFLGGGFPDDPALAEKAPPGQVLDFRFARMGRYLDAVEEVLAPGMGQELEDRARADFEQVAGPLADHPNGATLTAYLTRTLPGISLAPAKVLGTAQPTRMPIMGEEVIIRALRVPHAAKYDGVWYRDLLARADPGIAELPTAADLTTRRQHVRRISSRESAKWLRTLILGSPAAELLSDALRQASPEEWAEQLAKTKPQHLIRGLALLALWLEEYGSRLSSPQPPFARRSVRAQGVDHV